MNVIWHDLECGGYAEDITLWRALAGEFGDPVLDVGAGTGRITLDLAAHGHRVTALDRDAALLAELERRADGLAVDTVVADARDFALPQSFGLCLAPMQTIQLLGGPPGRARFLACARGHLRDGGALAIAITETLDLFDVAAGPLAPLPDVCELEGVVYSSQPTAVRFERGGFVLERLRETIAPDGSRSVQQDRIRLDGLTVTELEREAAAAGFTPAKVRSIPPTPDYVGSEVVVLRV